MTDSANYLRHPLFGTSLRNWLRLLADNGGVEYGFYLRALFITISIIMLTPARVMFFLRYRNAIIHTAIRHPPIFIIGHWRSGTTFLHELICKDPQFGYVSLWHTLAPTSFLVLEGIKRFFSIFLPSTRPMDEIPVDIDAPYEEEAGLAALSQWSFFHSFTFPRNAVYHFRQSVLFENVNEKEKDAWKNTYLEFLKTITYTHCGKQLILKNPANTARIKILLELFPGARFIYISRNPYEVYLSTLKTRTNVLGPFALQHTTIQDVKHQVIDQYLQLMRNYYEQQHLIPKGHLVELSYEDFVRNPLDRMRQIYETLELEGFKHAKSAMHAYLDERKDYRKNVYELDDKTRTIIENRWGAIIEKGRDKPPR